MTTMQIETHQRTELVTITEQLQQAVKELGIEQGWVTVFVPHTTAGVTINENADPDVATDMELALDQLIPWTGDYRHAEGNTAAHVKASLVGPSVRMPVLDGRLRLGIWQGVYFCEFDGPRLRQVWVGEG